MRDYQLCLSVLALLVVCVACRSSGIEPLNIHLASELDVGRELLKGCSSILFEAGALCSGRKPFALYPEPNSMCKSYFWCAPGRGACRISCPSGTLFDTACSCCKDSSSQAIDPATCTSQPALSAATASQRKLLHADANTVQPSPTQTVPKGKPATDDSTVIYHASSGVTTDAAGRQLPVPQQKPGAPAFGSWNAYGKRYSAGPFAGSNIVKEPALGRAAARPATTTTTTTTSSSAVSNEIGTRAPVLSPPAVFSEDGTGSPRALLGADDSAPQVTSTATAQRSLSMKRLQPAATPAQPSALQDTAATSSSAAAESRVDVASSRHHAHAQVHSRRTSPSHHVPPTAARALGPSDEAQVPFATQTQQQRQERHGRMPAGLTRSEASRGPSTAAPRDVIEVGQLTGPDADALRRSISLGAVPPMNPNIVPLPGYLSGEDSPYHYEPRRYGTYSTYKGHRKHHSGPRHGSYESEPSSAAVSAAATPEQQQQQQQ